MAAERTMHKILEDEDVSFAETALEGGDLDELKII